MAPFFIGLLSVLLGIVSVLIVLIVLMQRPKQEGLGAAFGGGMTDQMFGAQTTNVLQKGTVYLAVMFFVFALILSVLTAKSVRGDSESMDKMKNAVVPAPVEPAAPIGGIPGGAPKPVQTTTEPVTGTTPVEEPAAAGDKPAAEDAAEPKTETPDAPAVEAEVPAAIEEAGEEVPAEVEEAPAEVPATVEEEKPAE
jgi:preprotein translocase subunit SecG